MTNKIFYTSYIFTSLFDLPSRLLIKLNILKRIYNFAPFTLQIKIIKSHFTLKMKEDSKEPDSINNSFTSIDPEKGKNNLFQHK